MKSPSFLRFLAGSALLAGSAPAFAQAQTTSQQNAQTGQTPVYHVDVVEYVQRSTKAVNYQHRSGATKIDFEGTPLMPKANGEAKVESKQGYMEIEVEFDDLKPASQFGPEYLTYVMWAVTPEGRATNLGELRLNGNRGKLDVTTELQTFSMVVTAEPYFAVTQPSDLVVMENIVRKDTKGQVELVDTQYQLLKHGTYAKGAGPAVALDTPSSKMPIDLIQAENAIRISKATGAEQYAASTISRAEAEFSEAQKSNLKNSTRSLAIQSARQAVQTAEDARLIAIQKADEARQAEERRITQEKTAEAAAANTAAAEAAKRAAAEEEARRAADLARRNAEVTAARAAQNAERAAADRAKAEAAEAQALAARQQAESDALAARDAATKADTERTQMRERLQQQLNSVLETKETARGLVASMEGVLFDTGKATLKPEAKEKLAKVSGILLAHPDLTLEIEGHTDNTGTDETNQKLSENRAAAARDYLLSQGLNANSVTAKGLGETNPVASNDTSKGRAQNRRVELVISGASIQGEGQATPSAERKLPALK
jgi:outer membrane protein OmpA-like peptidoglycan-associated protein